MPIQPQFHSRENAVPLVENTTKLEGLVELSQLTHMPRCFFGMGFLFFLQLSYFVFGCSRTGEKDSLAVW